MLLLTIVVVVVVHRLWWWVSLGTKGGGLFGGGWVGSVDRLVDGVG